MTSTPEPLLGRSARLSRFRYEYLARHSSRVARLARCVGPCLAFSARELQQLELAAALHDVGKIGIPDSVLLKPGPLDDEEWALMRCHPTWGAELIATAPGLEAVAEIVLTHHERFDGGGYPNGLRGDQVSTASRLVAVCDAFDAIVSDRPHRPASSPEVALRELRAGAGTQFDPSVVTVFCEIVLEAA
jgi:HD-GYP domain-containing protein (c-di-GMP phosphodiesterase class II)